jgi:hypothetical protein
MVEKSTIHHLIALFCTVPAKAHLANGFATIFYNEIKDLEAILHPYSGENRSKLST